MFDLDDFVSRCRVAAHGPRPQDAVADVLREIVATGDILDGPLSRLGGADDRGVAPLSYGPHLTLLHVDLAPGFTSRVHDHGLWAAIGVYAGQEDNVLYGRGDGGPLSVLGRVSVAAPDVFCMGAEAIHHIENPLQLRLRALHAYGGDLRSSMRASYDPTTGAVTPEGGAAR